MFGNVTFMQMKLVGLIKQKKTSEGRSVQTK
jgi:hypothetical protein